MVCHRTCDRSDPASAGVSATDISVSEHALTYGVFAAAVGLVVFVFRSALLSTRANRSLTTAVGVLIAFGLVLRLAALGDVIAMSAVYGLDLALVTLLSLYAVGNIDRRIAIVAPGYGIGALACLIWPASAAIAFGVTHLFNMTVLALYYWWASDRKRSSNDSIST